MSKLAPHGLAILLSSVAALWSHGARAQESRPKIDIQLFHPTAGAPDFFSVHSGRVNSHLGFSGGVVLNYARNPLALRLVNPDNTDEAIGAVVANRLDSTVLLAFGLFDIVELGVAVPFILQGGFEEGAFDAANVSLGGTSNGFAVGDARVTPKVSFVNLGDGLFSGAVYGNLTFPLTKSTDYAGGGTPVYEPALALSTRVGPFRAALNGGYRFRDKTAIEPEPGQVLLTIDDEVFMKLGVAFDLMLGSGSPIEIVGEVYGHTPADNLFATQGGLSELANRQEGSRTSLEGVLGMRLQIADSLIVMVGGGGGLKPGGYGQAAPRVFAGVKYFTGDAVAADSDKDGVPDSSDKCPDRKEDRDGFEDDDGCPDLDNDDDNVLDEDDQCPLEPEDKDGYNDEDGCPEPDNDEDGLLDADDKCPNDAEDKDGFQDEDGCPDLDDDGDGVADTVDKCPREAEDIDGFQDSDGCPEPDNDGDGLPDLNDICPNNAEDKDGVADDDGCPEDNDGDGIPDELDKCPNKAEIYNGIEDEDGCPEKLKAKSLVNVTQEKIEIKETVYFKTGSAKILAKSFGLLDQVAAVLKNYKHLTKVRIEGHTDSRGNKRRNKKLSQERADSVRAYLVSKGVEPDRLVAEGYGSEMPIASNKTGRGREMNRRVEFMILEQKALGVDVSASQPKSPAPSAPPPAKDGEAIQFDLGMDGPAQGEQDAGEPQKKKKKEEEAPAIEFDF